ncbi:MAG: SMP-30/gluconolactonase/LRE family protein [Calditrichaeota bacterium]|nr:SMP-30/gluconolactonase/LRE family protein [Calditrichota bacterium]
MNKLKMMIMALGLGLGASAALGQTVSTLWGPNINIDDCLTMDGQGNLYGSHYNGSAVYKITPSGERTVYMGGFTTPNGLALDGSGNLFVADNRGNQVYRVTPDSQKIAFGPRITSPSGLIFDPHSDTLYVTTYTTNTILKLSPDGVYTPFLSGAPLNGPVGLAWDDQHNLYIANFNAGEILRVVAPDSLVEIARIPGTSFGANGFLAYLDGNLYTTGIGVHRIYRIGLDGNTTVFAGTGEAGLTDGPADSARFNRPNGIYADAVNHRLLISDYGTRTIREISGIATGIHGDARPLPQGYRLQQNFPNPFNPETVIRYHLSQNARVSLRVFDLSGREVAVLADGEQGAGEHAVRFDGSAVASGVYFYRLESGASAETRKMVLLR